MGMEGWVEEGWIKGAVLFEDIWSGRKGLAGPGQPPLIGTAAVSFSFFLCISQFFYSLFFLLSSHPHFPTEGWAVFFLLRVFQHWSSRATDEALRLHCLQPHCCNATTAGECCRGSNACNKTSRNFSPCHLHCVYVAFTFAKFETYSCLNTSPRTAMLLPMLVRGQGTGTLQAHDPLQLRLHKYQGDMDSFRWFLLVLFFLSYWWKVFPSNI